MYYGSDTEALTKEWLESKLSQEFKDFLNNNPSIQDRIIHIGTLEFDRATHKNLFNTTHLDFFKYEVLPLIKELKAFLEQEDRKQQVGYLSAGKHSHPAFSRRSGKINCHYNKWIHSKRSLWPIVVAVGSNVKMHSCVYKLLRFALSQAFDIYCSGGSNWSGLYCGGHKNYGISDSYLKTLN